ncbi:ribosomal protein S5 domain 2-type protein [Aspergillus granulosus]|uniref:Small ribosomal subunit protein uS9m n=1 Tax=Aspergillus granulosus TaxID=176169 RepID=A0ABR4HKC1_9EURO
MQSIRSPSALRAFLPQRSATRPYILSRVCLPTPLQQPKNVRNYATELQPGEVSAAAEIDFDHFKAKPARIVPVSPSYFSGIPKFYDHMLQLERLLAQNTTLPTVPASEAPRRAWMKIAQFREHLGEEVPTKKYMGLLKVVYRLNCIDPKLLPAEVDAALQEFVRPGNPLGEAPKARELDGLGRARGKGKRKASHAVVHLVEGEGDVLVNGKTLTEVFPRVHDRESATWPLRCTSRLDKYNVFARVRGGGTTGQAEAITLALARALLIHEPALKPILRKAGVVTVDPRRVERKKPGHVKARKMPTWVKR